LIRWNLLGTNLNLAKEKMFNLKDRTGEYADVPTSLYYKFASDNETLIIYGLNRGEHTSPGSGYTSYDWSALSESKINSIYRVGVDPDNRQFWPIWQVFLDGSNGTLFNDYGY